MALKDAQGRLATTGRMYLTFSLTHPTDGSLTLYLGGSAFVATNVAGGPPVNAIITSWGSLRQYLAQNGDDRDGGDFTIEVSTAAYITPSNSTKRYRLYDLLRIAYGLFDAPVSVYQWNAADTSQYLAMKGFWRGMSGTAMRNGIQVATIRISARPSTVDVPISEVIDSTAYPKAPQDSYGRMVSRVYGDYTVAFDAVSSPTLPPVVFGYGGRFVPGIDVDDSVTSLYATVKFAKNDGVSAASQAFTANTDTPNGDFWIYIPESGSYASIIGVDISRTNDSESVRANIKRTPKALACFRPTDVGTQMGSGLSDSAYKATDDDPTNFVETDATYFVIAWKCPIVSLFGGRLIDARVALDEVASSGIRTADFGLWDVNAGTWLNAKNDTLSTTGTRNQIITAAANVYTATDMANRAEFSEGRLITRDANGIEKPLEIRVAVTSGTKSGYRLFSVALVLKIELPAKLASIVNIRNPGSYLPPGTNIQGGTFEPFPNSDPNRIKARLFIQPADSVAGTQFLYGGIMQKDDLSGTITGTASAIIQKAPDVARHILQVLQGYSVNSTSGTLGNFVDARTEAVSKERRVACSFGIDVQTAGDAIRSLQKRWPMRLDESGGTWNIFVDEMNPGPERVYRSTSDPVKISARRDLILDKFSVSEIPADRIQNNIQFNYAHAHGTGKPMGSTSYKNPLSNESYYYGTKQLLTIDEPWIPRNDLINEAPHPAATFMAKWYGQRSARPRLTVECRLGQAFYDLRRGHVLEFDTDMEDVGIFCPAFRCGLMDYAYISSSDTTNYANNAAPKFVAASGSGEAYFMASQQFPSITFSVGTVAGYTTVASGWEYYDGAAWQALTGVVNADAMKSTGTQTVSWTRPTISSWDKAELSLAGTTKGPCYPVRMKYTSATAQGLGNAITTYPGKWNGRLFEVIEVTRRLGGVEDYPYVDAVLQEVM